MPAHGRGLLLSTLTKHERESGFLAPPFASLFACLLWAGPGSLTPALAQTVSQNRGFPNSSLSAICMTVALVSAPSKRPGFERETTDCGETCSVLSQSLGPPVHRIGGTPDGRHRASSSVAPAMLYDARIRSCSLRGRRSDKVRSMRALTVDLQPTRAGDLKRDSVTRYAESNRNVYPACNGPAAAACATTISSHAPTAPGGPSRASHGHLFLPGPTCNVRLRGKTRDQRSSMLRPACPVVR